MNKKNILDELDDNEILVETMLGGRIVPTVEFNYGYLKSFMANAMVEIPELKRRVEKRIAHHEFLESVEDR